MYVNVNTIIQITLVPGTNLLEICNFCKLQSMNNELMILKMCFSQAFTIWLLKKKVYLSCWAVNVRLLAK